MKTTIVLTGHPRPPSFAKLTPTFHEHQISAKDTKPPPTLQHGGGGGGRPKFKMVVFIADPGLKFFMWESSRDFGNAYLFGFPSPFRYGVVVVVVVFEQNSPECIIAVDTFALDGLR